MDEKCKALCDSMAKCIADRDFNGAHSLLAPWSRATTSADEIQRMVDDAGEGLLPPREWSLDEGMLELDDLRKPDPLGPPSKGLPKEVSAQNYRGWLCIQFRPKPTDGEDQNICFDVWLAAVEHDGIYRVGYIEAWEAS